MFGSLLYRCLDNKRLLCSCGSIAALQLPAAGCLARCSTAARIKQQICSAAADQALLYSCRLPGVWLAALPLLGLKNNAALQLLCVHRSLLYAAVCALIVALQLLCALDRWLPWSQSFCGSHSRAFGPVGAWTGRSWAGCARERRASDPVSDRRHHVRDPCLLDVFSR